MPAKLITCDEMIGRLSWAEAVDALRAGHLRPKARVADMFLGPIAADAVRGDLYGLVAGRA